MPEVSDREFQMLINHVNSIESRLESVDSGGTRGIGTLIMSVNEVNKDVTSLSVKLDEHERKHVNAERERRSSRRFWVTTLVAVFLAVETPIGWILFHLHR